MKKLRHSVGGFTLIELLVCSVLLSVAAVGVLNLLRFSESAATRGRLDSRAGLVFRDMVDRVSSMPTLELRQAVSGAGTTGPNGAVFTYGSPGGVFPFVPDESATDLKYLLVGKPLPGETEVTGMYPYVVTVEVLDLGTHFDVRVKMTWKGFRDKLQEDGTMTADPRSVYLRFQKWDASST